MAPARLRKKRWCALGGALTVACSPAVAAPEAIPGAGLAVEELLLARGRERPYDASALDGQALCFGRDVVGKVFRNGSIRRLGGKATFQPFYEQHNGRPAECAIEVGGKRLAQAPRAGRYETERCEFQLQVRGDAVRRVAVRLKDQSNKTFLSCVYRVTLLVEGFSGALTLPDSKLLWENDRSIFRSEASLVGEWSPDPFYLFVRQCTYPPKQHLSRASLSRRRICRSESES